MLAGALRSLEEGGMDQLDPLVQLAKRHENRLELGARGIVSVLLPVLQRDHDPLVCAVLVASEAREKQCDSAAGQAKLAAEDIARMLSLCQLFRNLCVECVSNQTQIGVAGVGPILARCLTVFCENRPTWREADCSGCVFAHSGDILLFADDGSAVMLTGCCE
jgi:hypothetical protein